MTYFLKNIRWLTPLLLSLSALVIVGTTLWAPATTGGRPAIARQGFPAPEIQLTDFSGDSVSLSQLGGKVVVVNFWASWCPPCQKEMPAFETTYRTFQDQQVMILGINATSQDTLAAAASFAQQHGLTFPILLDQDGIAAHTYLVDALPATFFIDQQGIIRKVVYGGPLSEALLQTEIDQLRGE